jgi:ankyrin repeat protein
MSVNIPPPANAPPVALPGKNNIPPPAPVANEPQPPRPNSPAANSPRNPSPVPNKPGSAVMAWKTFKERSATKYLEENASEEDELQSLKKQAQEVFQKRGPVCDSEGFYQHTGECWNDAIQQIFCNADGIKETMQYIYIHWVFNTDYHTQLLDWFFVPLLEKSPDRFPLFVEKNRFYLDEMKKWFTLYLRECQKRFLRHYLLETKRRNVTQEVCALHGPEMGHLARERIMAISRDPAFRKAGVQAEKSAIYGTVSNIRIAKVKANATKELMKPSRETYVKESLSGGTTEDEDYLINLFNSLFFKGTLAVTDMNISYLRSQIVDIPAFITALNNTTGCLLGITKYTSGKWGGGHAMAFYQCGKQELFYEDNFGILPFEWRQFFIKFVELTKENLDPQIEFTDLHLVNKEEKIFFFTGFAPILSYTDKEGKFHTLLMLGGETLETNDGTQTKFTFKSELGGTQIKLDYNKDDTYRFSRAVFLTPAAGTFVSNVGFEHNVYARIGRSPIIRGILEKDLEATLEAIELERVIPDLKLRREGNEDIPIIHLAFFSLPQVIPKLIEKGYDTKSVFNNHTVLERATLQEDPSILKFLIEREPSLLELKNEYGRTPLSLSSTDDELLNTTKYLVEAGADIETKSNLGRTPLFFAARAGVLETVQYLCSKGANPQAKDNGHPEEKQPPKTPIEIAKTAEIKEFLTNQCGKKGGRRHIRNRLRRTRRAKKRSSKKTRKE